MVTSGMMYYEFKDYQINSSEPPTFFATGELEKDFNLDGKEATKEIYENLRDGKDPHTGEQLVKPGPNGEHRAGVDICITPDKSFSAAYAAACAAGDEHQKDQLMGAFHDAANDVKNFITENQIYYRDSQGNDIEGKGAIGLVTYHFGDRDNQYDWHAHLSFYSMTKDSEGNYRAVNSDDLYRKEMNIAVGDAAVACRLNERGFSVYAEKYSTGKSYYTKIDGVSEEARALSITRSETIDKWCVENQDKYPNATRGELRQMGANATKKEKVETSIDQVQKNVEAKAQEKGVDLIAENENIRAAGLQKNNINHPEQMTPHEIVKTAADILTQSESVFTKERLRIESSRLNQVQQNPYTVNKIETAINKSIEDKQFLNLENDTGRKGKVEYMTTQEMKTLEANIVKEVREGQGKVDPIMSKEECQTALADDKYSHLTNDQKNMVEHVLTSPDKYSGIDGLAGTGKTTADAVTQELAEIKGYQVHGLAPTGTAAEKLEAAGVKAQTIDKFILSNQPKEVIPKEYGEGYHPHGRNTVDQKINEIIFGKHGERDINNIINTKVFGSEGERDLNHQIDKAITGEHGERSLDKIIDNKISDVIDNAGTKGHIFIVDESSMGGSIKAAEMMKIITENYPNARVVFQGDQNQLSPIAAGNPFNYLHSLNAINSVKMTETVRFQSEQTKDISRGIANKDIDKVFNTLEKSCQLHEIKNRDNLISAITNDYCSRDIKNTVVIASTNQDRKDINDAIRDTLREQGKIEKEGKVYTTREALSLTPIDKHFAQNYKVGDSLFASKSATGFKPGQEGTITSVDPKNNTLTVEKSNGREVEINLTRNGSKFSGYRETETEFVKGDRALFTKNDDTIGVKNGTTGTVLNAESDYLKVKLDNGKIAAFDTKDYSYVTHANCITNHKMQGATTKESIAYLDSKNAQMNNYQAANVALTRAEDKVTVYTDNVEKIKEQIQTEQVKMDTLTMKSEMQELNKFTNEIKDKLCEMKDLLKEINDKNLSVSKDTLSDVKIYATSLEIAKETIEKDGVYRVKDGEQIDKNIKEIHEEVKGIEDRIKEETKDVREMAGEVKDDLKKELETVKETLTEIKSDISNPDTLNSLAKLQSSFDKSVDIVEKIEPYLNKEDGKELHKSVAEINKSFDDVQTQHKDYSDMKNELADLKNTLEVVSEHNVNFENKGELMNQCKEQLDRVESYAKTQFENDKNTLSEVSQKVEEIREVVDKIEDKGQEKDQEKDDKNYEKTEEKPEHEPEIEHEDKTEGKETDKTQGKDEDNAKELTRDDFKSFEEYQQERRNEVVKELNYESRWNVESYERNVEKLKDYDMKEMQNESVAKQDYYERVDNKITEVNEAREKDVDKEHAHEKTEGKDEDNGVDKGQEHDNKKAENGIEKDDKDSEDELKHETDKTEDETEKEHDNEADNDPEVDDQKVEDEPEHEAEAEAEIDDPDEGISMG